MPICVSPFDRVRGHFSFNAVEHGNAHCTIRNGGRQPESGRRGEAFPHCPGDAALFHVASVKRTSAGQRLIFAVLFAHLSRSKGSADNVGDRSKDGAYHCSSEWFGGAIGEPRVRREVQCAGGSA